MNQNLLQNALRAHRSGNLQEAARLYDDILRMNPANLDALRLLAQLCFQCGQFAQAERLAGEAIKRAPNSAETWFFQGCVQQRLDNHPAALQSFGRVLALEPTAVEPQINRGISLMALRRYVEALEGFDAALTLNPDKAEAWNNRGNALSELGRYEDAAASYERALVLAPGIPETLINRGTALLALRRTGEARASYDDAARIDPGSANALSGRANAAFEMKRYEDAAGDYEAALALDHDYAYARGNLAFCRLQCCDWRRLGEERARIVAQLHLSKRVVDPFANLALSFSPDDQHRGAAIWTADKYPASPQPLWRGERYGHDKIRVAYLSADFHVHATALLMAGTIEHHDRDRFETIAVSYGPDDGSEMRDRLRSAFGRFLDVERMSVSEIARMLREMEVDIAVDLKGYTADARPGILAQRPAPVQASYLGFPGTMGADHIDYIIADRIVIPEDDRGHYSEKTVYLPDTYQCNDGTRAIAEKTPARADAGLPESGFVFCCFNNSYKIQPETFDVWMRILARSEGSVLWLIGDNEAACRNLKREAELRGIAGERLVFASRLAPAEHLARHRLADLCLDTSPYGAHTTASDALWTGVPVLTCPGPTFAGRVAAGLLKAVGLPELVVGSLEDYENLAVHMAQGRDAHSALKAKLAKNKDSQPLFDTARFTRHLEAAFVTMRERSRQGLAPQSFAVEPIL